MDKTHPIENLTTTNSHSTSPVSDPLLTQAATSSREDFIPPPNIIITRIRNSTSLIAYKIPPNASKPKRSFTVSSPSEPFTNLLNKAPTFSFSDRLHWTRHGSHKIIPSKSKRFKAAIYLDDLPKSIARPKLAPVTPAVEEDRSTPAVSTSITVAGTRQARLKGRALGAAGSTDKTAKERTAVTTATANSTATDTTSTATLTTTAKPAKKVRRAVKKEKAQKPATAAPGKRRIVTSASPPPAINSTVATATATATTRPKGLEIDMVPGTFMATGEQRSSRARKRPARFEEDEAKIGAEKQGKKSKKM
ncbi:MAG: hypothetical protein Q9200_000615 [Gallowayella weberi]